MPIVDWSEILSLKMEPFDTHHKHLVGLLNKTYDDFTADASKENLARVLDELIDYACYHFAAEELWMKENKYPRLEEHVKEHEAFSQKAVTLQKDFYENKAGVSLGVLTFIKEWLIAHIMNSDADYSSFAAKVKGLSRKAGQSCRDIVKKQFPCGEMSERLKEHAWKACVR